MNCLTEALGCLCWQWHRCLLRMLTASSSSNWAGRWLWNCASVITSRMTETVLPRSMGFKAFENAIALDIAMGGSTNTILRLLAIAQEAEIDFTMADIDRMSRIVPQLYQVAPNANKYHIEMYTVPGGIMAILGAGPCGQSCTDVPLSTTKP